VTRAPDEPAQLPLPHHHTQHNTHTLSQRLPISLPELVDAAPSLTADGSLILGSRDSKVFALDRRSGRSVSTLSNLPESLEDHSGSLGEEQDLIFMLLHWQQ
jgi:hypothetical protein